MSLQPSLVSAQYALALALDAQEKNREEALQRLAQITDRFPPARMLRARILTKSGQLEAAMVELRSYLEEAKPRDREQVARWLNSLRHAPLEGNQ